MGALLDLANSLLDEVVAQATVAGITLPTPRYAQLGTPVIATEVVVVGTGSMVPIPQYDTTRQVRDVPMPIISLSVAVARAYKVTDRDGVDIPDLVTAASATQEIDGQLLWDALWGFSPGHLGPSNVNVSWDMTGEIAITTGTLSTGVY